MLNIEMHTVQPIKYTQSRDPLFLPSTREQSSIFARIIENQPVGIEIGKDFRKVGLGDS